MQREFIGADDRRAATATESNLMLSADQNIVEINFSVLWRVSDPKKFLFNVSEPEAFLRRVSESAMRELVGRSTAEEVRTERRAEVEEGVRALVQGTLDAYDAGISIVGVQLERADPPAEVADAFEEVQRAQQDLDRFQREAEQYANRRLGDARGEAAQITEAGDRLQAAGRGRGGRRVAALPLRARRIRAGRGRDAQAPVPRDDGARPAGLQQDHPRAERRARACCPICRSTSCSGTGRRRRAPPAGDGRRRPRRASHRCREQPNETLLRSPDRPRWSWSSSLYSSIFIVNEREQALVLRFGEITRVIREPGIYFKIPTAFVDTVQIIEDRLLSFDIEDIRVQVRDGRRYIVDAFVAFRIIDPRKFRENVSGSLDIARENMRTRLDAALRRSTASAASRRRCRSSAAR